MSLDKEIKYLSSVFRNDLDKFNNILLKLSFVSVINTHVSENMVVLCLVQRLLELKKSTSRVSAGLKFTSDILSKQPQYCSDI